MIDDEEEVIRLVGPTVSRPPRPDHVVGDLCIVYDPPRAYWKGEQVGLPYGAYLIVRELAENDRDVAAIDLFHVGHPKNFKVGNKPDSWRENIRTAIKRIRGRFREVDPTFDQIDTYNSYGYRWRR